MTARLTFFAIAAFWLTMNGLLWRAEFGAHGSDTPVPVALVWKKILTAPDASSLSVYQNSERMGYCEFSTGVGQEMAVVDDAQVPPEGLAKRAGYLVHLAGNVALGDFTNRLKFDGYVKFSSQHEWSEVNLRITAHQTVVAIHSFATNQILHLKITSEDAVLERNLTFADLRNPNILLRAFAGNLADPLLGAMEMPGFASAFNAPNLTWSARRMRVKISSESVPIYRLETSMLGRNLTVDVSTLGEVLRIQLPGDISARIDGWSHP